MSGKILIAPEYHEIVGPLVFLAGPIQGALDWQAQAICILQKYAPELHIANPRRPLKHEGDFTKQMFNAQTDWETYYLNRAAYGKGAILFWLAKETEHFCNRSYAQTSRFELSEWKVKHERDGVKLVVGIETAQNEGKEKDAFTGAKYMRRRFAQDCPEIAILSTLEETCERVVKEIHP